MGKFVIALLLVALSTASLSAQSMPASIVGKWRITRVLPTTNPQCWDRDRAKTLIGTLLTYQPHAITWQGGPATISEALTRTLSRRKFQDEYKVDLPEIGISALSITEIDLQHEDADFTGATTEVPGDTILLAGPGKLVVTVCGVFYAATRATGKPAAAH
jgi:hypothetical protein